MDVDHAVASTQSFPAGDKGVCEDAHGPPPLHCNHLYRRHWEADERVYTIELLSEARNALKEQQQLKKRQSDDSSPLDTANNGGADTPCPPT